MRHIIQDFILCFGGAERTTEGQLRRHKFPKSFAMTMSDVTAYQVSEQLQDNDKEHEATARNSALQPPLIQALQIMLVSSSFYVGHVAIGVTAVLPLSCLHLLYVRNFETEQASFTTIRKC